jgi:hypothetical protein
MNTELATRERPIIFNGWMVRAILADQKTQTRRVAKPPEKAVFLPDDHWENDLDEPGTAYLDDESGRLCITCPHGQPGDRLWVRETWSPDHSAFYPNFPVVYRANGEIRDPSYEPAGRTFSPELDTWFPFHWRSPLFMPHHASRITLEITGVRVERLQAITEEDAIAEGMHEFKADGKSFGFGYDPKGTPGPMVNDTAIGAFALLWESINAKKASWDSNPWIWVIAFKRIKP